jgi:hypothetical protein
MITEGFSSFSGEETAACQKESSSTPVSPLIGGLLVPRQPVGRQSVTRYGVMRTPSAARTEEYPNP